MTDLHARYQQLAQSTDPVERAVAKRQLEALQTAPRRPLDVETVSAWSHVPLAALFEAAGNALHERRNGTIITSHEPVHGSKSGTCVVVWPAEGRWWCSSCRQGGDAVRAVRSLEGCSYPAAVARLTDRYGAPGVRRG